MAKPKPSAKEIRAAREAARHHRKKPGEKRAVAPRPLLAPTKKRPAGETSLTWNLELEKPPPPPPNRPKPQKPVNLRVGKRKPKKAKKLKRALSAKKH
ncbi:MAG: hypothetical protein QOH08_2611 [Chloroflexota bacterium]|jgi:hypothetical protein|nr:hypothetical protein [Chloroflexota bacterium]